MHPGASSRLVIDVEDEVADRPVDGELDVSLGVDGYRRDQGAIFSLLQVSLG